MYVEFSKVELKKELLLGNRVNYLAASRQLKIGRQLGFLITEWLITFSFYKELKECFENMFIPLCKN